MLSLGPKSLLLLYSAEGVKVPGPLYPCHKDVCMTESRIASAIETCPSPRLIQDLKREPNEEKDFGLA